MLDEQLVCAVERATGADRANVQMILRAPLEIQSNALYDVWVDGRHLIAKQYLKADELTSAPAREYAALQLLAPYDIAPQPVYYDPTIAPVVLYEYVEGEMWDRRRPSPQQLATLADLWLTMHAMPTVDMWLSRGWERTPAEVLESFRTSFDRYAAWCTAHFPPGKRISKECHELLAQAESIFQELSTYAPQLCFYRADPRFANVITRPDGRLTYIDWEDSGLRDPARDLADMITHPNQEDLLSFDEWQPFLQPYLAERMTVDPTIQQRMHLYCAIFPLFWLAIFLKMGIGLVEKGEIQGWQINGLPANLRLQRYLARAIAWPATDFTDQLERLSLLKFFPLMDG